MEPYCRIGPRNKDGDDLLDRDSAITDPDFFDWDEAKIGDMTLVTPHPGESLDDTLGRMRAIADRYRDEHGLHFLVTRQRYDVAIKRLREGPATRLREWLSLAIGEFTLASQMYDPDLVERLVQIAKRLNREGRWRFVIIDLGDQDNGVWIARKA